MGWSWWSSKHESSFSPSWQWIGYVINPWVVGDVTTWRPSAPYAKGRGCQMITHISQIWTFTNRIGLQLYLNWYMIQKRLVRSWGWSWNNPEFCHKWSPFSHRFPQVLPTMSRVFPPGSAPVLQPPLVLPRPRGVAASKGLVLAIASVYLSVFRSTNN